MTNMQPRPPYPEPINGKEFDAWYSCEFEDNNGQIHQKIVGVYAEPDGDISSSKAAKTLWANYNNMYSSNRIHRIVWID